MLLVLKTGLLLIIRGEYPMKNVKNIIVLSGLFLVGLSGLAEAHYGARLCKEIGYHCVKVQRNETWESLFPNHETRDMVRRVNRMNISLSRGMTIAVPDNLNINIMAVSPFPAAIEPSPTNKVIFNQEKLAWGAYDESGHLVKWGPAAGGKNYCPDIERSCRTMPGDFTIYQKRGEECVSTKFPVGEGGAPMPYCMFFHGGYALHGSPNVPGFNASHGCVRLFTEDAEWLNEEFIHVGRTKVIVK
jgi:hypothetical protein